MFMMISGYFMIDIKELRIEKIVSIFVRVLFYSVTLTLITFIIGNHYNTTIGIKELIGSFMPLSTTQYWYISSYFLILVFCPWINILLKVLTKKDHKLLIVILSLIWLDYLTIKGNVNTSNSVFFLLYLYILVAYYKINGISLTKIKLFVLSAIILTMRFLILALSDKVSIINQYGNGIADILCAFGCLLLFALVSEMKTTHYSIINEIAGTTFGIYLLHDNGRFKGILWTFLGNCYCSIPSTLKSLLMILTVFISCSCIDYFLSKSLFTYTDKLLKHSLLNNISPIKIGED